MSARLLASLTNEEYHKRPEWCFSQLKLFLDERDLFEAQWIDRTVDPPEPSRDMVVGTLLHLLLLEPELFHRRLAAPYPELAPDGKKWLRRKGSDHAKWWYEEVEKRRGLIAITEAEREQLEGMAAGVRRNKRACQLLYDQAVEVEQTIVWRDNETGLDLRCRPDGLADFSFDLKTARDVRPERFAYAALDFRYHLQRRHYQEGIKQLRGDATLPPLLHICVKKTPPYTCAVYDLSAWSNNGDYLWRKAKSDLAGCLERRNFTPWYADGVVQLNPPRKADYQGEYEA